MLLSILQCKLNATYYTYLTYERSSSSQRLYTYEGACHRTIQTDRYRRIDLLRSIPHVYIPGKGEEDASSTLERREIDREENCRLPSLAMYEHKGFIALLRFAHARFFGPDRVLKRRKMENRNFETSLLFETWVSPAHAAQQEKETGQASVFSTVFYAGPEWIMRIPLLSAIRISLDDGEIFSEIDRSNFPRFAISLETNIILHSKSQCTF